MTMMTNIENSNMKKITMWYEYMKKIYWREEKIYEEEGK